MLFTSSLGKNYADINSPFAEDELVNMVVFTA